MIRDRYYIAWLVGLASVALILWSQAPVNPDTAWLLLLAQELVAGKQLYIAIFETNPPMAVWVHLPAAWIAALTPLSVKTAWLLSFVMLAISSLWMLRKVALPFWLWGVLAITLVFGFGSQTGQREQIILLFLCPYLLQLATGGRATVLAAAMMAVGVLMKPYFALLPLIAVIVYIYRTRPTWQAFLWMHASAIGVVVAFAAYVFVINRLYLDVMIPQLVAGYSAYNADPTRQWAWFAALPLLVYFPVLLAAVAKAPLLARSVTLLLYGLGVLTIAIWQQKTFINHMLPVMLFAFVLNAETIASLRHYQDRLLAKISMVGAVLVCFSLAIACVLDLHRWLRGDAFPGVTEATAHFTQTPNATHVHLGLGILPAISAVLEADQRYSGLWPHAWFLTREISQRVSEYEGYPAQINEAAMTENERAWYRHTIDAFVADPPDWIAVERQESYYHPSLDAFRFDILSYYQQDAVFAKAFSGYRLAFSQDEADYYYRRN